MTTTQANIQFIPQTDSTQNNTLSMSALQSELALLQAKVVNYYQEEIVQRGDKILMREYCGHFGIAPAAISR